ncbi:unnamed protein product [Paramecium primaurelia]|uniref:PPIase cyclophilin-type domain-containing protein n=1 Tax=Paramecium primaurelia TaxID=5886 RepID=A0A8S1NXC4_PARPR|nr:unnamed protein product [Paramecium primaurelia]
MIKDNFMILQVQVIIKVSSNVYTSDTVEELMSKPKFWKNFINHHIYSFITLAKCKKYDGKYAVFGEVVSGYQTLYQINKLFTNMQQRPEVTIKLKELKVIKNPFRDMIKIMLTEKEVENEQKLQEKHKERWLDDQGFALPTSTQEQYKKQQKQYCFDSWL